MDLTQRANRGLHAHVVERAMQVEPRRDATVLDLGCGTGALLSQLHGHGYSRLLGLDIAPPTPFDGIDFLEADLDDCQTGLNDGTFDLLIAVEVIEHVENLGLLLNEMHRLLVPRGKIIFTTPNVHSLEARIRWLFNAELKQFDRVGDPTHVMPIFEYPFRRILRRHGLAVMAAWGFPEDGSSPTSRPILRRMSAVARALGLRGNPAGDQWCLLVEKSADEALTEKQTKRAAVTSHYERGQSGSR